jgi:hypothetical protein
VALCQARISTKPLWGFSSSNPYHSQSRAEHLLFSILNYLFFIFASFQQKRLADAWQKTEGILDNS